VSITVLRHPESVHWDVTYLSFLWHHVFSLWHHVFSLCCHVFSLWYCCLDCNSHYDITRPGVDHVSLCIAKWWCNTHAVVHVLQASSGAEFILWQIRRAVTRRRWSALLWQTTLRRLPWVMPSSWWTDILRCENAAFCAVCSHNGGMTPNWQNDGQRPTLLCWYEWCSSIGNAFYGVWYTTNHLPLLKLTTYHYSN